MQLEQRPNVDSKKLTELLVELDRLLQFLNNSPGKLGQKLRENEFLNPIRMQLPKSGGMSNFNGPAFYFWLQQTSESRFRALNNWFKELENIHKAVELLLQLTRETGTAQLKFAQQGFYQESLDANIPYQLIRVALPKDRKVYPEISVGRYGLSIHFYSPNFDGRAIKAGHEIPFKLACCIL
jgi:cell division protein ZapD